MDFLSLQILQIRIQAIELSSGLELMGTKLSPSLPKGLQGYLHDSKSNPSVLHMTEYNRNEIRSWVLSAYLLNTYCRRNRWGLARALYIKPHWGSYSTKEETEGEAKSWSRTYWEGHEEKPRDSGILHSSFFFFFSSSLLSPFVISQEMEKQRSSPEPHSSIFINHHGKLCQTFLRPSGSWRNLKINKTHNFIEVGTSPETCKLHVTVNQSDCANTIRIPTKPSQSSS